MEGIKDLIDYSWASGLLEGEGSINILRSKKLNKEYYQLYVCVDNSDKILIDKFHRIFPIGSVITQKKIEGKKQMYRFIATGEKGASILRTLYPFMTAKQNQAGLGVSFQDTVSTDKSKRTEKQKLVQEHCYQLMKAMKKEDYDATEGFLMKTGGSVVESK